MPKHEFKWAPDLPHMEVRRFLAEHLRSDKACEVLDRQVIGFLGLKDLLPAPPPVTSDLDAAIALIPKDWWWHLSHNEAKIIPTTPAFPNAPIDNAQVYDFYGKPVGFSAICWERSGLPVAVCEALLKAYYDLPAAFVVHESATGYNEMMLPYYQARSRRLVDREIARRYPGLSERIKRAYWAFRGFDR